MSCYKALISKHGEILSISREGDDSDKPCMDIATGSIYPDAIFVNASDNDEAERKVKQMIHKAAAEHQEHS